MIPPLCVVFNPWFHVFWNCEFHDPVICFFVNRVFVHFWARFPPNGRLFWASLVDFRSLTPGCHLDNLLLVASGHTQTRSGYPRMVKTGSQVPPDETSSPVPDYTRRHSTALERSSAPNRRVQLCLKPGFYKSSAPAAIHKIMILQLPRCSTHGLG